MSNRTCPTCGSPVSYLHPLGPKGERTICPNTYHLTAIAKDALPTTPVSAEGFYVR